MEDMRYANTLTIDLLEGDLEYHETDNWTRYSREGETGHLLA
jgi:hypothetical protein